MNPLIDKKIFEKNIRAVIGKNFKLAEKLQKINLYDTELINSKTNMPVLKYKGKFLNSVYDPEKEAKMRVSKQEEIKNAHVVFSMGFGMGYEIKEIINSTSKKTRIVIIILDLELFMTVISCVDVFDILANDKLIFIDGTRNDFKSYFHDYITDLLIFHSVRMTYFLHPVITSSDEEITERTKKLHKVISDVMGYRIIELGNSPRDSIEGLLRIMHNFDHIVKSPNIKNLKDALKGVPAICVSSGPSLDKNFEYLRNAEGKAIIFGVESNVEKLVNSGLKFDAAAVHERVPHSYYISLKHVDVDENVVFFGESVAYHKLFEKHKGKNITVFRNTTVAEDIFGKALGELNSIPTGISVAHLVFSIAYYLGCSPIIMVGQDLAYDDKGFGHTAGTLHMDSSKTAEELRKEGKINSDEILLKGNVKDYVRSTKAWKDMLEWFEIFIEKNNIFTINSTEGGAYINGTEVMSLKDSVEKYCNKELDFKFQDIFDNPDDKEQDFRKKKIIEVIDFQEKELYKFDNIILDMKRNLKNIRKIIDGKKPNFDLDNYMIPQNHDMWKIFNLRLMLFITQPVLVDFARKIVFFEHNYEKDKLEQVYNEQASFIGKLMGIENVVKELFRQGRNFIENGEPFTEEIVELLEMREGLDPKYLIEEADGE